MARSTGALRRFVGDHAGSVAVVFTIATPALAMLTAFAVEYSDILTKRSRMQAIADELVMSSVMSPVNSALSPYYSSDGGPVTPGGAGWLTNMNNQLEERKNNDKLTNVTTINDDLRGFYYNQDTNTVGIEKRFSIGRIFGSLINFDNTFTVKSEASMSASQMNTQAETEIALVFDVSSSMLFSLSGYDTTKWTTAQTQAKAFVARAMQNPNARVALVPFGNRVAVDALRLTSANAPVQTFWGLNTTGPSNNFMNYNVIESSPNSTYNIKYRIFPAMPEYLIENASRVIAERIPGTWQWDYMESTLCPELPGSLKTIDDTPPEYFFHWYGKYDALSSPYWKRVYGIKKPLHCNHEPNMMISLNSDPNFIQTRIDGLQPYDQGTRIDHGLLWGWYNLSPKWKGKLRHSALPSSNSPDLPSASAKKYLVMFTDGENFQSLDWYRCTAKYPSFIPTYSPEKIAKRDREHPDTQGCAVNYFDPPDSPDYLPTKQEIDEDTLALCTKIKNAGIEIFYVKYQQTLLFTANNTLDSCASGTDHLFNPNTASELQTTFQSIHNQMNKTVRMTR